MRRILPALLLAALPATAGDADALCARLTRRIEALLGPKFDGPVPIRIVSKDFLGRFARSIEERLIPPGLARMAQLLAERLHQVPPGYDLMQKQIEMIKERVAGLYDPDKKCFYIVDKVGDGFVLIAAHELIHAYRDVDTGYWARLLETVHADTDRALALSCLIEGDATFLGTAFGLAAMRDSDVKGILDLLANTAESRAKARIELAATQLKDFPVVLREMLAARYAAGEVFAASLYRRGGLPALAAAYRDPPLSTEQVLHPRKYPGDEPTPVADRDPTGALGAGWHRGLSNTMGEFEMRLLFVETLGRRRAESAADGWDGARYHFCLKEGLPSFVGVSSVWDTEKDAAEFASAWAEWASRRDGGGNPIEEQWPDLRVRTKEGLVVIRRQATRVGVADGVPEDRVEEVLAALGSWPLLRDDFGSGDDTPTPAGAYLLLLVGAVCVAFLLFRRSR